MAKKRQYVNLDPDPGKNQGREFLLSVRIKEKKKGDSEGRLVYLFVDRDPKNLDEKWLRSDQRTGGFHFDPPSRKLVIVKDQVAAADVKLSIAGGDKYKFLAGKKYDRSNAVSANQEVEVWRKIYLRLGRMSPDAHLAKYYDPCPTANLATTKATFEKSFVEIESDGPHSISYRSWMRDIKPLVAELDAGRPPITQPSRTSRILFVDRIGKGALERASYSLPAKSLQANKVWTCELPGGSWTWPPDKGWVSGSLTLIRPDGSVFWSTTVVDPLLRKHGGYSHPEGTVTQTFKIDLTGWPSVNPWINAGSGTMRFTLDIWTIGGAAQGFADGNNIAIGTFHPYTYAKNDLIDNTVIHELGHALGLKVRWAREYDQLTGAGIKWHDNTSWYDNTYGGMGTHCHTGATLVSGKYANGTCAMLHYTTKNTTLCDDCQKTLIYADLSSIGYRTVWPESWMAWKNKS